MCLLLCPLDTSYLKVGDVGPASTHSTEKCFLFLFTSNSWLSNQDYTQLWEIPTSNKAGIFMTRTFCCGLPLVCIVYADCKVKQYWLEPNKGRWLEVSVSWPLNYVCFILPICLVPSNVCLFTTEQDVLNHVSVLTHDISKHYCYTYVQTSTVASYIVIQCAVKRGEGSLGMKVICPCK